MATPKEPSKINDFIYRMTSRKFWLVVGTATVVSYMRYAEHLGDSSYATIMTGIVGAYVLANAAQRIFQK